MTKPMNIAVDCHGGDFGLKVTIPACIQAITQWDDFSVILVGKEQEINQELGLHKIPKHLNSRISIQNATQVVLMDDSPVTAMRQKKDSSMRVMMNLVKQDKAQGCVSAGNTGALMAIGKYVLKTIANIERPAICTMLPGIKKNVTALDLGANVEVSAEQLVQFAIMGSAISKATANIAKPSVALMNVGSEDMKGSTLIQQAHTILNGNTAINYVGFAEGDDLFSGDYDVLVMGGSEGNIALKSAEGAVKLIFHTLKTHFNMSLYNKLLALICLPVLRKLKDELSPTRFNGACLAGLNHIVVKSHGNATTHAFVQAIGVTRQLINNNTPSSIRNLLEGQFEN